jgi:hypothetical protein
MPRPDCSISIRTARSKVQCSIPLYSINVVSTAKRRINKINTRYFIYLYSPAPQFIESIYSNVNSDYTNETRQKAGKINLGVSSASFSGFYQCSIIQPLDITTFRANRNEKPYTALVAAPSTVSTLRIPSLRARSNKFLERSVFLKSVAAVLNGVISIIRLI